MLVVMLGGGKLFRNWPFLIHDCLQIRFFGFGPSEVGTLGVIYSATPAPEMCSGENLQGRYEQELQRKITQREIISQKMTLY